MEWVLGLFIFAVLFGFALLMGYLRRQATKALAQKVFERGKHARGQDSTKETIEFIAPTSAAQVINAVRARLGLSTVAPGAFVANLYLAGDSPGVLTFVFGNKLSQTFRSALLVDDIEGGGSKATYKVLNWVESDGIVRGIPEMELLANTIRTCAADLGATYATSVAAISVAAPTSTSQQIGAQLQAALPESSPLAEIRCLNCGSAQLGTRFCTDCGAALV